MSSLLAPLLPHIDAAISHVYSYQPLAAATVVLVPAALKAQVTVVAQMVGMDEDTVKYTLGMFLCYPLGAGMASLPYGRLKHLFSFLLGAFLLQFAIGAQWVHHLLASSLAYLMLLLLPRSLSKRLVPLMIVAYVTLGHLHRQYVNYLGWDLDFTGPHMVLTIKLYSLAWNLWDGEVLAKGNPGRNRATEKCGQFALREMPSLLEFMGYTFCFSNVLAGPSYEFSTYKNAAEGKFGGKPGQKPPSQIAATLKPFIVSVICMVLFVVGSGYFPVMDPSDPQHNAPTFVTLPFPWWKRYGYQWLALMVLRFKYYFAWKNAEGANNTWHAGFEGFDEKGNAIGWENANNIDIWAFETAPNLKMLSAAWNKKTSNWLTRYVYMRTGGSLLATYGMSAFWHGFYPGYYMFFLSMPMLTACERIGRKKLSPRFSSASGKKWTPWGIVTILTTSFLVEYFIQPFQMLSFEWGMMAWRGHYFFGHIAAVLFYVGCSMLSTPKPKEKKQ